MSSKAPLGADSFTRKTRVESGGPLSTHGLEAGLPLWNFLCFCHGHSSEHKQRNAFHSDMLQSWPCQQCESKLHDLVLFTAQLAEPFLGIVIFFFSCVICSVLSFFLGKPALKNQSS